MGMLICFGIGGNFDYYVSDFCLVFWVSQRLIILISFGFEDGFYFNCFCWFESKNCGLVSKNCGQGKEVGDKFYGVQGLMLLVLINFVL